MIGAAVDYLANATNRGSTASFVAASERRSTPRSPPGRRGGANIDTAIDKWFDDARAAVVLASQ
jgi:hypothetical protein